MASSTTFSAAAVTATHSATLMCPSNILRPLPYPSVLLPPTAANASAISQRANGRVDALAPSSLASRDASGAPSAAYNGTATIADAAGPEGTPADPLIPKRRRRTSPGELAVLEQFFSECPLPTQAQRAQLASTVGMTGRALQVWFQNRRQKEKKEASQYNGAGGGSSAASSTGSATDPDQDAADLEGLSFAFSSSPVSTRMVPSKVLQNASTSTATPSARAASFNGSSDSLYSGMPVNKENLARLPPLSASHASAQSTLPTPPISAEASKSSYTPWSSAAATEYTYKGHYAHAPRNAIPVYETDLVKGQLSARVSTSSSVVNAHSVRQGPTPVIAAKKHVRKRPLGSHAPLARRPSLPHTFNFPDSPPHKRSERLSTERPPLRRAASSLSVGSGSGAGDAEGSAVGAVGSSFLTLSMKDSSHVNRARVWVDALDDSTSTAPVPSPETMEDVTEGAEKGDESASKRGFSTRDEVWQHMASDAPSSPANANVTSHSSASLSRRAIIAHSSGKDVVMSHDDDDDDIWSRSRKSTSAVTSGKRTRGGNSMSMSAALEGSSSSRAGGEAACALSALERKRARLVGGAGPLVIGDEGVSAGPGPRGGVKRRKSNQGQSVATVKTKARGSAASSSSSGSSSTNSRPAAGARTKSGVSNAMTAPSPSSSSTTAGGADDSSSTMGDLSFSSTSTHASSFVISTPPHSVGGGYSATAHKRQQQQTVEDDDERECAELLLGLGGGGFF